MKQLEDLFHKYCMQENLQQLPRQLEIIKEFAKPELTKVERACQQSGYTFHGENHVNRLGKILFDLIPTHLFGISEDQIGPYEIFILIGAIYTHDLGMLNPNERKIHNRISADLIWDLKRGCSKIEGVDDQYAYRISQLCLAHRDYEENQSIIKTLENIESNHLAGREINMPLLACLFRLADELDSDFERAPDDLERSLPLSEDSIRHWTTHQLIDSITINSNRWEITIHPSQRAKTDLEATELVKKRKNKINKELSSMQPILEKTKFAYKQVILDSFDYTTEKKNESKTSLTWQVKELFELCGYNVKGAPSQQAQNSWDLIATPIQGLERRPVYIKCVDEVGNSDLNSLLKIREDDPLSLLAIVAHNKLDLTMVTEGVRLGIQLTTYDQLVSQMINFSPYVERVLNDPNFLNLQTEYVEPYIEHAKGKSLAWDYLEDWSRNDESNWLTVLGDYGVGKTSLLQMHLKRAMEKYKNDPENNPIPILIPLQNFVKTFTFRNLILALFEDIGLSGVYYNAFENWVKRGRILLLLDSFDEMAQKLSRAEIQNNLKELMGGITGKSKAILTSRPTYFESGAERLKIFADVNLLPQDHEDYDFYKKFSEYDVQLEQQIKKTTTVSLSDLSEEQKQFFFAKVLRNSPEALSKLNNLIKRIHGLAQMTERPVIARLLMMAVPSLKETDIRGLEHKINEANLFKLIMTQLLKRDESLFGGVLTNSERHLFLKELAYIISRQGNDNYVTNNVIKNLIDDLFKHKIKSHETPEIIAEQYFRTCRRAAGLTVEKTPSGLSQNPESLDSRVGFSHNALREFLYAEFINEHLFSDRANSLFSVSTLTDGALIFLHHLLSDEKLQKINTGMQSFSKLRDFYFSIIWKIKANQTREEIELLMNQPPDFSELDLGNLDLGQRDLSSSKFFNSLIGGVNFKDTDLTGADFRGAVIEMTAFDNAILDGADFSKADIQSIVVYDPIQKRALPKFGIEAKQWLFTSGSEVGLQAKINSLTRSPKYRIAQRILRKMARYNFGATHNEVGLLRGIHPDSLPVGRTFMRALHNKGYFDFIRRAAHGGRGADVIAISRDKRSDLQKLFEGNCPSDLIDFFDDLPT
ncbi:MAG: NACHT domain-containing protein [Methylomicrobium sp.]|nr:NACHT domain-containing protein [Methylomicrobium sp.]